MFEASRDDLVDPGDFIVTSPGASEESGSSRPKKSRSSEVDRKPSRSTSKRSSQHQVNRGVDRGVDQETLEVGGFDVGCVHQQPGWCNWL